MRVLVTGATGFVGRYVVQELLQRDVDVVVLSRSRENVASLPWSDQVEIVEWTIGTPVPPDFFEQLGKPELVVHLAWDGLPDFRRENHATTIYQNHFEFLRSLIEQGASKLAVTGTCLEYGMKEGELEETMKPEPTLPYPIGKNNLRESLENLRKEHPFQLDWIRLFYMYGEGQSPKSILAQLERHIEEKEPVFNMSKGEQIRDYLPVEKIAEVIVKLALLEEGNGIVNCCSGHPITIMQLVEDFIAEKGATITLNPGYYPYPDYEPFQFWGSTRKLNQLLETE